MREDPVRADHEAGVGAVKFDLRTQREERIVMLRLMLLHVGHEGHDAVEALDGGHDVDVGGLAHGMSPDLYAESIAKTRDGDKRV